LVGPGDTLWRSDLEALRDFAGGRQARATLEAVVAKYFINAERETG